MAVELEHWASSAASSYALQPPQRAHAPTSARAATFDGARKSGGADSGTCCNERDLSARTRAASASARARRRADRANRSVPRRMGTRRGRRRRAAAGVGPFVAQHEAARATERRAACTRSTAERRGARAKSSAHLRNLSEPPLSCAARRARRLLARRRRDLRGALHPAALGTRPAPGTTPARFRARAPRHRRSPSRSSSDLLARGGDAVPQLRETLTHTVRANADLNALLHQAALEQELRAARAEPPRPAILFAPRYRLLLQQRVERLEQAAALLRQLVQCGRLGRDLLLHAPEQLER